MTDKAVQMEQPMWVKKKNHIYVEKTNKNTYTHTHTCLNMYICQD